MNLVKIFPLLCFILFFSPLSAAGKTYFSYTNEELKKLENLSSPYTMDKAELQKIDEFALKGTDTTSPASIDILRLYTYLYVAQSDAAILSNNIKGYYAGSLAPLSRSILTLFFPDATVKDQNNDDAFSKELSVVILNKIKERIAKEDSMASEYEIPDEKKSIYSVGLDFAKLIPWTAVPKKDYFPPPPPESKEFWQEQIAMIKKIQSPMTPEKKKIILFWAGEPDPLASEWRFIANQYLFKSNLPFQDLIKVRSALLRGLYDSMIIGFSAKYQFIWMRPQEFDPSIQYEIPVPKHPSYPANHPLAAWTAATILDYYIPSEKSRWDGLAAESGLSRIWAGVHYPYDVEEAKKMGTKIGAKIVQADLESK